MKKFAILQKTEVVTVSLLSLVLFLRMFSIFLVLPVFNILAQEINNANFFLVALAFGIYGLTQGLCQLPAGYFSDVWGRKRILIIALILFLIGSLLASYVTNIYWIIAARFIQGMGAMASVVLLLYDADYVAVWNPIHFYSSFFILITLFLPQTSEK